MRTWEHLATLLPPDSDDARTLQGAIADARAKGGTGGTSGKDGTAAQAKASPAAGASVSGRVELDAALKAKAAPGDTVMVIARVPGTRMPVAVLRARASDLPMRFTLDDSLAMSPQARISMASEVEVEARISKSGLAKPEPGDMMSAVRTVKTGTKDVNLRVSEVRP